MLCDSSNLHKQKLVKPKPLASKMAAVKKVGQKNGVVGLLVEYLFCGCTVDIAWSLWYTSSYCSSSFCVETMCSRVFSACSLRVLCVSIVKTKLQNLRVSRPNSIIVYRNPNEKLHICPILNFLFSLLHCNVHDFSFAFETLISFACRSTLLKAAFFPRKIISLCCIVVVFVILTLLWIVFLRFSSAARILIGCLWHPVVLCVLIQWTLTAPSYRLLSFIMLTVQKVFFILINR